MNDHRRGIGIRVYHPCLILLLFFLAISPSAGAADAMFRANPQHTGVYDNGGVVENNTVLWEFMTGDVLGSNPSVWNNTVYVGSRDNKTYAIDAVTGSEKWRFETGWIVDSSPAVSNGIVYVGSLDKNLYAIDALTGSENWRFKTGSEVRSSPVVSEGFVYVGSDDNNLYAIDAVTGSEKWRFKTGNAVWSSPSVSNGIIYIGSHDRNLYAVDALTGKEKWRFETGNWVDSSPAVSNGVVYVGSYDKNLYAIDALTGKEKWRFETGNWVHSSPAVSNGVVYVGSQDNTLYAINAVTGIEQWRFTTGNGVYSSPAISNGVIYIGSRDYNLYAIDALTGKEKWRYRTAAYVFSSPAVSNGVVYVGSYDNYLYAVGVVSSIPTTTLNTVSTHGIQSTSTPLIPSNSGNFNSTLPIIVTLVVFLIVIGGYTIKRMKKTPSGDQSQDSNEILIITPLPQEKSLPDTLRPPIFRDLIFISSKSEDFDYTKQVYTFLKERGYNVFFSQQSLPEMGSCDYRKEIDSALDASKHMIVVTSKKEFVEASWVEAEWGLFINEKRSGRKTGNIITLIIGTLRIEDLPSSLRYYEVIPFDPKNFEKILKYLK